MPTYLTWQLPSLLFGLQALREGAPVPKSRFRAALIGECATTHRVHAWPAASSKVEVKDGKLTTVSSEMVGRASRRKARRGMHRGGLIGHLLI